MNRFVSLFLPALSWLEEQVKVVCMVNGMLKPSKHFRGVCRDFRQSLAKAGIFEGACAASSLPADYTAVIATC